MHPCPSTTPSKHSATDMKKASEKDERPEDLRHLRRELSPEASKAFDQLTREVYRAGALSIREKQLIAVAVAHALGCSECIHGHSRLALRNGATEAELMEAIWVAAQISAGSVITSSTVALRAARDSSDRMSNPR